MKKRGYLVLIAILLVLCAVCAGVLLQLQQDALRREQELRQTVEAAYQATQLEKPKPTLPEQQPEESAPTEPEEPYVSPIDFASLQAVNPDIYAWLYIPNSDISYPLVQRDGNDAYYLDHDSDGNYDWEGAIFTEQTYSSTDFTEPVTVVYGHRLKSGRMFSSLQSIYSDPEGMEECSEIVVYLPERELHYTVFAAVPYDNRHILYTYNFNSRRMYEAFLNTVYGVREIGAVFQEDITVSSEDQMLILSTCLYGNAQKRYLILAKCGEDNISMETMIGGKDE